MFKFELTRENRKLKKELLELMLENISKADENIHLLTEIVRCQQIQIDELKEKVERLEKLSYEID